MKFLWFCLLAMFLSVSVAHAHVTANPNMGDAGAYFETKFRVTHGCEGSDVIGVRIEIPKELISAKPQTKAGWTINIQKSKLETPVKSAHGKMIDERVDVIEWRGGVLPDSQYNDFGLMFKLPDARQEKILWFKTTQICKDGQIEWNEIPPSIEEWHSVKSPAPYVKVTPSSKDSGHKH